jgi:hypothetical protein
MSAKGHVTSSNFSFLAKRYPQLERIGARGERYFSDDPVVTLISVRQFGEVERSRRFHSLLSKAARERLSAVAIPMEWPRLIAASCSRWPSGNVTNALLPRIR